MIHVFSIWATYIVEIFLPRVWPNITPEKEQFGSFVNSKLSQKWRIMEHFGFLIVPDAIILFCTASEKYRKETALAFT